MAKSLLTPQFFVTLIEGALRETWEEAVREKSDEGARWIANVAHRVGGALHNDAITPETKFEFSYSQFLNNVTPEDDRN